MDINQDLDLHSLVKAYSLGLASSARVATESNCGYA